MTKRELERATVALGLEVEEKIINHTIDIVISSPAGKSFGPSWHSLVTHWHNDYPQARQAALDDAKQQKLEDCAADCTCREEDEEKETK